VRAANSSHAAPKRRRRLASIETVPTAATMLQVAKKTSDVTSPLPMICTIAQSATPTRNGCQVTPTMPLGGAATRASWPSDVGLGIVSPITTSSTAGIMSAIANGFHHKSRPQVGQ